MVQQFLRSGQAITPSTNAGACRCGSTRVKPATRPTLICGASPGAPGSVEEAGASGETEVVEGGVSAAVRARLR
jgi:hypothetical protein